MGDQYHRQCQLAVQALQVGQDLGLALGVQRGQRLVHQQQARAGGQRAGNRHALALAARQRGRPPRHQPADAQQLDHRIQRDALRIGTAALAPVGQVGGHIQVRKQRRLLDHIAQRPLVRGQEHARGIVLPHLAVDDDAAGRALQPGECAQHRGLAAARGADQRGDVPVAEVEIDVLQRLVLAIVEIEVLHRDPDGRIGIERLRAEFEGGQHRRVPSDRTRRWEGAGLTCCRGRCGGR